MNQAVDDLMVQTQKLPAFLAKVESTLTQRRIVIDPLPKARAASRPR